MDQEKKEQAAKEPEKTEKKGFFSRLFANKRLAVIAVTALVLLLAGVAYLVLSLTVLKEEPAPEKPTIGNHGESMVNGRPFVIEPIEADRILSIRVTNDQGGFCYYKEDGQYYFEGAETILYSLASSWDNADYESMEDVMSGLSAVDTLIGLSRYMLALTEVENYDPTNLAAYGLSDGGSATLTVTFEKEDGSSASEKVIFGSRTVTGTGYYVMKEGRDAVYVINANSPDRCVFTSLNTYLSPQVAPYVLTAQSNLIQNCTIKKHGEVFVAFRILTEEEANQTGGIYTHVMTTPAGYYPSLDNLESFFSKLANFVGSNVVEYNVSETVLAITENEELTKEEAAERLSEFFRQYNLRDLNNNWTYELSYRYESFDMDGDFPLYISDRLRLETEDGSEEYVYYVYSPIFDVIVEFTGDSLPFVEWDRLTFMDNHSYATTIDQVAEMTFSYGDVRQTYTLKGTGQELVVTASNKIPVVTDNFRQLYKAVLFTTVDGYADAPEDGQLLLTVRVKLRNGDEHVYDFYGMTARKAFYTLNGKGEFYINRDYVRQIILANDTLMTGGEVVVSRKN